MRTAQWSRVAKSLKEKYGLSWEDAKRAYAILREKEGRAPSLRLVKSLPDKKPRYLSPKKKTFPPVRAKPTPQLPPIVGRNIELAPPIPPAKWSGPVKVRKNQYARNNFEAILKEKGLPVKIARNTSGKEVSKLWKSPRKQRMIANRMKAAFQDIKKYGRISIESRDRLQELMENLFEDVDDLTGMYYQFVKTLYGKKPA